MDGRAGDVALQFDNSDFSSLSSSSASVAAAAAIVARYCYFIVCSSCDRIVTSMWENDKKRSVSGNTY